MKKYADKKENLAFTKNETLEIILKNAMIKSLIYEKALKEKYN